MATTKVIFARSASKSVRTTVPKIIREFLEVKEGDQLDWTPTMIKARKVVVVGKVGT